MSCFSINKNELYDINGDEAMFKRQVIKTSDLTYFLMDQSKIDLNAPMLISSFNEKIVIVLEENDYDTKPSRKILMSS